MDEKRIIDYENKSMEYLRNEDSSSINEDIFVKNIYKDIGDALESDEEFEESIKVENEHVSSQHSSVIKDRYHRCRYPSLIHSRDVPRTQF